METIRNQNGCMNGEGGCTVFTNQPISLAMAYVAMQQWQDLYDPDLALERGTIFSQLDMPFLGKEAAQK